MVTDYTKRRILERQTCPECGSTNCKWVKGGPKQECLKCGEVFLK